MAKKKKKKIEKQANIIGIVLLSSIVLILLIAVAVGSTNKFKYLGVEFEKQKYGDIVFYTGQIPLKNQYNAIVGYTEIDFRNDPRELKDIKLDLANDITFKRDWVTFLSVAPELEQCEDSGIAIINLGAIFLKNVNVPTTMGYMNKTQADKEGRDHATCATYPLNTVIEVKSGQETAITSTREGCYELTYKDCEVLDVVEKFQLEIIRQHVESLI